MATGPCPPRYTRTNTAQCATFRFRSSGRHGLIPAIAESTGSGTRRQWINPPRLRSIRDVRPFDAAGVRRRRPSDSLPRYEVRRRPDALRQVVLDLDDVVALALVVPGIRVEVRADGHPVLPGRVAVGGHARPPLRRVAVVVEAEVGAVDVEVEGGRLPAQRLRAWIEGG